MLLLLFSSGRLPLNLNLCGLSILFLKGKYVMLLGWALVAERRRGISSVEMHLKFYHGLDTKKGKLLPQFFSTSIRSEGEINARFAYVCFR